MRILAKLPPMLELEKHIKTAKCNTPIEAFTATRKGALLGESVEGPLEEPFKGTQPLWEVLALHPPPKP